VAKFGTNVDAASIDMDTVVTFGTSIDAKSTDMDTMAKFGTSMYAASIDMDTVVTFGTSMDAKSTDMDTMAKFGTSMDAASIDMDTVVTFGTSMDATSIAMDKAGTDVDTTCTGLANAGTGVASTSAGSMRKSPHQQLERIQRNRRNTNFFHMWRDHRRVSSLVLSGLDFDFRRRFTTFARTVTYETPPRTTEARMFSFSPLLCLSCSPLRRTIIRIR
jgi:hypothetical protein